LDVAEEFTRIFSRKSFGLFEEYKIQDAETIFVSMGSIAGPIKDVVDELREKGQKVGFLRIITYRPFPSKEVGKILSNANRVIVIDKSISLGSYGPLYQDVVNSVYINSQVDNQKNLPKVVGYICGLGGRDVYKEEIIEIYNDKEFEPAKFVSVKKENLGNFI
jgi:pyruvate ferredoxin oxidoreductase alpha subunit